jgi:hypothetical protein
MIGINYRSKHFILFLMLSLSLNFVQTYAVDVPEDIGMSNVYYILPNPDSGLFFVSISNDNAIEIDINQKVIISKY